MWVRERGGARRTHSSAAISLEGKSWPQWADRGKRGTRGVGDARFGACRHAATLSLCCTPLNWVTSMISNKASAHGMGYTSKEDTAFRCLKSIQNQIDPCGFGTNRVGLHQGLGDSSIILSCSMDGSHLLFDGLSEGQVDWPKGSLHYQAGGEGSLYPMTYPVYRTRMPEEHIIPVESACCYHVESDSCFSSPPPRSCPHCSIPYTLFLWVSCL